MVAQRYVLNSIGLVAIFLSLHAYAKNSINDVLKNIDASNISQLKDCAYKGGNICKRDLGLFYSYNFELPNGETSMDIEKAKLWLSDVTYFPSVRYALGENLYQRDW